MWTVLALSSALAYESDTLTDRHLPLPDVTEALDDRVRAIIADAIAQTNRHTRCDAEPEVLHRQLAHAIHVRASANELVGQRGGLRALGFDAYSAWIEKGGAPHRAFDDRRDVLGSVTFRESPLLVWAGVCSTVSVNGVLVGTDKLDHFFEEGYDGWRHGQRGDRPQRTVDWLTRTENGRYGLKTSEAFSFGDLRADADGVRFYDTLLDPGGLVEVGEDGCLVQARPFRWADYVDAEYDEVLNPPVYTPEVQRAVTRHLQLNRDAYCASYAAWGGPDYSAQLARALQTRPAYVGPDAPLRTDPYHLDELCAGWSGSTDLSAYIPPSRHRPERRDRSVD